jgi:2-desacetyl-2-hydroxyethyl bacteriochlorophyllide A dehydrogenase
MNKELMNSVIITGPGQASVQRIARWLPEPGEVLIRCQAAAICTTERRIFAGLRPVYPVIGGHEFSGVIEWVGSDSHDLKPGDRVAVDAVRRCGYCHYCIKGHSNHCVEMSKRKPRDGYVLIGGGFAEFSVAPASRVVKLPDEVSFEAASLIEPFACCLHSMKRAPIAIGDVVAIVGAGTMGSMHLLLAKLAGAWTMVSDPDEARLDFAKQLGADEIINPQVSDPVAAVKRRTEGRGADAVIVTAGSEQAARQALDMAGRLSHVILYASAHPPTALNLDWNRIHYEEIILTGSFGKTEKDFHEAAKLLASQKINFTPLISEVISLQELPSELAAEGDGKIQRVVVKH